MDVLLSWQIACCPEHPCSVPSESIVISTWYANTYTYSNADRMAFRAARVSVFLRARPRECLRSPACRVRHSGKTGVFRKKRSRDRTKAAYDIAVRSVRARIMSVAISRGEDEAHRSADGAPEPFGALRRLVYHSSGIQAHCMGPIQLCRSDPSCGGLVTRNGAVIAREG